VKVRYATQARVDPPELVLFTSGPLTPSYRRYLERDLRPDLRVRGHAGAAGGPGPGQGADRRELSGAWPGQGGRRPGP
jgi:hypothetical protein